MHDKVQEFKSQEDKERLHFQPKVMVYYEWRGLEIATKVKVKVNDLSRLTTFILNFFANKLKWYNYTRTY